ncbi:vWA domain-containing protein [Vibrio sp. MA40-2]|uniref:vWA domain-containing protein n=1 Tax=Vibrio sp. MA40-2 TaxID=3391828 RepID=UPI0039A6D60D
MLLQNIEFVWWGVFLLLPLPVLIYRFAPAVKEHQAITLAYLPNGSQTTAPSNVTSKLAVSLIWLCLVVASARPVWFGEPIQSQPKHRDMMLVVDLSGSMDIEDMAFEGKYFDRLTTVKRVLTDFINKREGDRLGLILFADHAYLQTPLTLDRTTIKTQINQAVLGLVGNKTAIGEGLGLATKTLIDSDAPQRVMILLSDGTNTAGVLDPLKAAEIAKKYQATIYTVGIGAGEMMVKDFFVSRKVDTAKDLDEATLSKIAQMTGGQYFRARNEQDLQNIYQTINELEPVSGEQQTWRPQTEWFGYPLSVAFLLSLILIMLRKVRV